MSSSSVADLFEDSCETVLKHYQANALGNDVGSGAAAGAGEAVRSSPKTAGATQRKRASKRGAAGVSAAAPGARKRAAPGAREGEEQPETKRQRAEASALPVQSACFECSEPFPEPSGRPRAECEQSDDEAHMRGHGPCLKNDKGRCKGSRNLCDNCRNIKACARCRFRKKQERLGQAPWHCPSRPWEGGGGMASGEEEVLARSLGDWLRLVLQLREVLRGESNPAPAVQAGQAYMGGQICPVRSQELLHDAAASPGVTCDERFA